ncbi:MAG: hypothetical protein AMJ79_06785 [Phycisphaerae bacterium SM23_30]|nr:MAG: hypothetical protein AMJ79_06785 [Phycisphaerae bacterium SM23_30]
MVLKRKEPLKQSRLKPLLIKPDGALWDVEKKTHIACVLDLYDNCFGRCRWLSIDENQIARCQNTILGKISATPKNK